jgi:hypothetical protein
MLASHSEPTTTNTEETMLLRNLAVVSMAATLWAIPPAALADTDAGLGTWKLNTAKSKFKPGPAPKEVNLVFEASGKDGLKSSQDVVSAAGEKTTATYTVKYDGKDYPIKGSPSADTTAFKMVDAKTVERVDKKGGKVVTNYVRKVSADGKTMTVTQKGTAPNGQPMDNLLIFDRTK